MPLSYDLEIDRGIAMGLIVLQTDELMEFELGKLFLGLGLRVYQNRIPCMPEVRPETLSMMGESMTETAAMLPHEAGISVIGYGCTSGATILGEDRVTTLVQTAHPGVSVTNPLSALKAACASLGVASLGLVSPYVAEVTGALVNALENHGIPISSYGVVRAGGGSDRRPHFPQVDARRDAGNRRGRLRRRIRVMHQPSRLGNRH